MVCEFDSRQSISKIAPHVPTKTESQLSISTYNLILKRLVSESPQKLLLLLRSWPFEVYSQIDVIKNIHETLPVDWVVGTKVESDEDVRFSALLQSLVVLFEVQKEYDVVLDCLLRLRDYAKIIDLLNYLVI